MVNLFRKRCQQSLNFYCQCNRVSENKANLKIAESEYEIASLSFQQKLLDAGIEVNDALSSWQTAKDRLILDKKQIVALKGAVHNTRLLMRNSNTNYLEVLTAQQRLLKRMIGLMKYNQ